ncbi:TonB-dependent receptor [Undibacterium sp. 5I1]|uniref:TonB-dependent receptor n=2 Tax=unclassified Undibacterium TaxID=2630295 RepID=UPI002AB44B79|nr:TonB-dependent receptor [Undibacterium sp. 5I1]MDY7539636.1 TonB-dependent receptor [Undibacterium sp. 5I1]MEB0257412.1 TonB-dependent receptor [Undibacterium sp. 5I1]
MSKKNLVFKKTLVAHALTVAFGVGVLAVGANQTAMAQSNTVGTVYGKVVAGTATSVVLKNTDTNLTRTVTIDATGKYQATALPSGHYKATLLKDSSVLATTELDVLSGQGAEPDFGAAANAGVQSIEVSARRSRIDVSNSTNGATFTAKELAKLPVARNVDAIIQLAPNTTRGDPTYAAGASFAGGGASENAYYINGFPVTNPLTQLGASELPFGAIAQADILVGGYGVEFGRSVGGVVNITGKSGTNNWEVGATASITPNALRATPLDYYYPVIGASNTKTTDGTLRFRRQDNSTEQKQVGAYVGGPIIKDKLFMFLAAEATTTDFSGVYNGRTSTTNAVNGWQQQTTKLNRYYSKFDWNITDNHRLELTALGDLPKVDNKYSSYDYTTRVVGSKINSSDHQENNGANGGEVQILKYTGNLTDNLTLTGSYGQSKATHIYQPAGYNPNVFQVAADANNQAPGFNYNSPQGFSGNLPFSGSTDTVKAFRLDLEYKLGQHTLRAGLDNNSMTSLNAGDSAAGGGNWTYLKSTTPNLPTAVAGGTVPALTPYGGLAAQGYYVEKILSSTVSNAYADQAAQYIEDRYQITKDILLTAGLRNEQFSNSNQDKVKYIEMKNQLAPRFSAAWDVNGDSSLKVFGSAGRYTVQMPTVVALRGANGSLNTNQYFAYTGTDANGSPTGLTQLTNVLSANNEYGQAKDPKVITSTGLKPSYQDEITLGFEKAYSANLNFGAKVTYRTLRSTIDDFCDQRPFDKWAARNNVSTANWQGFGCASFNPGEDNDFLVDFNDANPATARKNYTKVHLTAADLGFEKAERKYTAVDLFAEHPYRSGWYGKLNYTWSRSTGNTEGQTLSDTNTGQADVAATQTWDYRELMLYANGLLPNDRTHQIKAYGFYDLTPQLSVGGNLLLAAGRPRSCSGTNPTPADSPNYTSASHYCFGATGAQNIPSPRGTVGNLEWDRRLDLNIVYKPSFLSGLSLKLDVFNVFDAQTVQKVVERYNTANVRYAIYEGVLSYSAPRTAKLTAEYNYKF